MFYSKLEVNIYSPRVVTAGWQCKKSLCCNVLSVSSRLMVTINVQFHVPQLDPCFTVLAIFCTPFTSVWS